MSGLIYFISRELGLVTGIVVLALLTEQGEYIRAFSLLSNLILFMLFSKTYEKRVKVITPSYLFVFVILLVNFSIVPAYCTQYVIDSINAERSYALWPKDFYWIYYFAILTVLLIINTYVRLLPNKIIGDKLEVNPVSKMECQHTVIGSTILFILYLIFQSYEILVVALCGSLAYVIVGKKRFLIYQVIIVIALDYNILFARYKIAVVFLSLGLIFILISSKRKFTVIKSNIIMLCSMVIIGTYGAVSEIIKLNKLTAGSYDIKAVFSSTDLLMLFFEDQVFRIFSIWTKLGGYIIQHVQDNGFFYGVTYIKEFSELFDIEYVSLPIIGAYYNLGSYAQPGLLAEGYANFGFIGAVINILIVFFLMEYLFLNFINRRRVSDMLLLVVPFGQILLDGGTLNSALIMIMLILLYNFNYMRSIFKFKL